MCDVQLHTAKDMSRRGYVYTTIRILLLLRRFGLMASYLGLLDFD